MKILWISWKDRKHPQAGGAEVVMHEIIKRQIASGHEVTILTAHYPGSAARGTLDGAQVIRLKGNRYIQPLAGLVYYLRYLRNKHDIIIEAVNTAPYFSPLFRGRAKSFLLYHQLARKIWFYEAPFPISLAGYLVLEPLATFILSKSGAQVITVSESTKADLVQFGFKSDRIRIISEGIEFSPATSLRITKYERPTLLVHGAMRPMKNTLDQIKAFEVARQSIPALQLKISGSANSTYGQKVLAYIKASPYVKDIEYLGRTSDEQKIELMQRSHIHLQTAHKEGWGITITEANSQGTPAVVYDADGLRDSVRNNKTGIVTDRTPEALAKGIVQLLSDPDKYEQIRRNAWEWSKTITFDQSYKDINSILSKEPS